MKKAVLVYVQSFLFVLIPCASGQTTGFYAKGHMPEFMQARPGDFTNNGYRVQVLGFSGFRHDKTVTNVEYFPDGKRIMSSSHDGSIRVWEAKNGNELFCFKSKYPIKEAVLSDDGKRIILCGFNTITVWDVEHRNIISKFNLPAERRRAGSYFIAVSKDGRRVMTGGSVSDIIRLWDTATGKLIKNLKVLFDEERPGLKYPVSSAALSFDGNFAVFGCHDRHNRDVYTSLWDLDKGREIKKLKLSEFNIVKSLAFSPDGERIIISSEFGLNLWDIREGIEVRTLDSNLSGVISASFSMDGKKVVVCHMSGVAIFDADTGYEVRSFQGGRSNIQCASASPDLDRVVLGDSDGAIKQKDFAGDREIVPWKYRSDDIRFIQFSPDGSMLLSGDHNSGMKLWDQSGRLLNSFRDSNLNKIICGAFSRDGKRLLSGSMWGVEEYPTLHQWDIRKPAKPTAFKGNNKSIWAVAFSAKGKVVSIGEPVTAFHGAWKERIFKKRWKEVKLRDVGRIVAFHPDHRRALVASTVVASKTGHLSCWDFKTGKCPAAWIDNDNSQYTALAFSPDGERILMVAKDLLIKMKDFQTGETLQIFKGHTQPVNALCFSPDGRQVISAGEGRTIYVWGAKTGKVLETIHNRTGTNPAIYGTSVRRLSVSPAGKRFAAANANGTICLYTKLSRKHDEKRGW